MTFLLQQPCYGSAGASLAPLFRLVHDFDKYSQNANESPRRRQQLTPTFTPKFDVRETDDTYELHGELPGVDRENISVEFPEPQQLVIQGQVKRNHNLRGPVAAPVDQDLEISDAINGDSGEAPSPGGDRRAHSPYQATVEDESADEDWEEAKNPDDTAVDTHQQAPVTATATVTTKAAIPAQADTPTTATPVITDGGRYLFSERSVGRFSRSFDFPVRVDQDGVSAQLSDGILSVTVPKERRHKSRRITVN